jgi:hypothetical protein
MKYVRAVLISAILASPAIAAQPNQNQPVVAPKQPAQMTAQQKQQLMQQEQQKAMQRAMQKKRVSQPTDQMH